MYLPERAVIVEKMMDNLKRKYYGVKNSIYMEDLVLLRKHTNIKK
jgi:hypothetical protein